MDDFFFCSYTTLSLKMNSCQGSWIKIVGCLGTFLFLKGKNYLLLFFENGFLGVGCSVGRFFVSGFADTFLRLACWFAFLISLMFICNVLQFCSWNFLGIYPSLTPNVRSLLFLVPTVLQTPPPLFSLFSEKTGMSTKVAKNANLPGYLFIIMQS